MALHYQADAYMYTTARIRALENGMVGKEKLARLMDVHTAAEAEARLSEMGVALVRDADGRTDREGTFDAILKEAFALCDGAPQPERFRFLHDRYDCNNIKAVLKSRLRGIAPGRMLMPCGSVPADRVAEAVESGQTGVFPAHMAAAIPAAMDACTQTGNAQLIDRCLDRACFADMAQGAKKTPVAWFSQTVRMEADLINLRMCVRVLRMGGGENTVAGRELARESLLPGGALDAEWLLSLLPRGEAGIGAALSGTPYEKFGAALKNGDAKAYRLECLADNLRMEHVRSARYVTYGAQAVAAYVIGREYEVRNLRILLAGLDAKLDGAVIRERMRESYV